MKKNKLHLCKIVLRVWGSKAATSRLEKCGTAVVAVEGRAYQLYTSDGSSLSIRRFWGKGERWKRKRERAEGEKRLTQMLLLEPSTPTHRDSIRSNQNHFRPLGCHLHVSKSSPKIKNCLRSGRAPVLVCCYDFAFF